MKKFLSVFFAVLFVLSSFSMMASAWETSCPYCGEKFTTEAAYTEHMTIYNHTDGHYIVCPFTGEDYKDGGCGEKFATKAAYDVHVATCKHNGDYSTRGYLNLYLGKVRDAIKAAKWGDILGGLWTILKAIFFSIDFKLIWNILKTIFSVIKG